MAAILNAPVLFSLLLSAGINTFFFVFAAAFKTDKVTDLSYSLSFFIMAPLLYLSGGRGSNLDQLVVTAAIMIWALRLGSYLLRRIMAIGKDERFDDKRSNFKAFLTFWILQALVVWIVMLPFSLFLSARPVITLLESSLAGIILFTAGLVIEGVSDHQKFIYKSREENRGHWVDKGLWKYSRHPNYFGEIVLWWGLFLIAAPTLKGVQWITVIGPLTITLFLLKVSGIPILEKQADKKYGNQSGYTEYKTRTSILVPLPRRKGRK